jgi:hypothetical protein
MKRWLQIAGFTFAIGVTVLVIVSAVQKWGWFGPGGVVFIAVSALLYVFSHREVAIQVVDGRRFDPPVAWLVGRQLLRSLQSIAHYAVFGDRTDPKNWMQATEIDLSGSEELEDGDFWFDYVADIGDGVTGTYSVAYMCHGDVWVPNKRQAATGDKLSFRGTAGRDVRLPRGRFLFIGGDTAYHMADYPTLVDRLQKPFEWAFNDRGRDDKVCIPRRPIFGIPGNHDYYDVLHGFNLQFRRPVEPDIPFSQGARTAPLFLWAFSRRQESSYISLNLPNGWRFLGLDTQAGKIDERQLDFFLRTLDQPDRRKKLVVATPEPAAVFGQHANPNSEIASTFKKLNLWLPFKNSIDGLPPQHCRLDLSGDVHHYVRYWGRDPIGGDVGPVLRNYASVVCGTGGAFLHPSHTDFCSLPANKIYPDKSTSHHECTWRLLNPWHIARGGLVWLAAAIICLVLYFAATIPESTRSMLDPVLKYAGLPGTAGLAPAPDSTLARIGEAFRVERRIGGLRAVDAGRWCHRELWCLPVFALTLLFCVIQTRRVCRRAKTREVRWHEYSSVYVILPFAVGLMVYWIIIFDGYKKLHPFVSSLLVLTFLALGAAAFCWSRIYDEALYHQARMRPLTTIDYFLLWLLFCLTFFTVCFGLWRYGVDSLAVVVSDITFTGTLMSVALGLPLFAACVGGCLHATAIRWCLGALGFFHAVLHVFLSFLLVAYGDARVILTALLVVILVNLATMVVTRTNCAFWSGSFDLKGDVLLAQWLVLGVVLLCLAFSNAQAHPVSIERLLLAPFVGAWFGCVWFGWYLAVTVPFNCHNNEAGGGSRIEKYRGFIRIRLTDHSLTGYVVAIDKPEPRGQSLKPRIIDVFEIRC